MPAEKGRLKWRARRGTLELDRLVGWWLEHRYDIASAEARLAFDQMLDQQDPDLWDWLMGAATAPERAWQEIVDDIRAAHQL